MVSGLLYANIVQAPAREVVVAALLPNQTVLASATTDINGNYTLTVPQSTTMIIEAKAQLKKTGAPSWDIQVVDNTASGALYVLDSAAFNSGTTNITNKNLNAASGWTGAGYANPRASAPFAILDVAYNATQTIVSANSTIAMPQLLINWSVNNVPTTGNKAIGQIGTSHYDPQTGQLYILGKENVDTDENDSHVIAHEFGHYFEDKFSRSDSPGGPHGPGDKLTPAIAFGEGWGNAFSGMALNNDPLYIDTSGAAQAGTFGFDLTNPNSDPLSIGSYSEDSVQYVLYGLNTSFGFAPIYNVMANQQKTTNSFTNIYSFISYYKAAYPANSAAINALLTQKNISTTFIDPFDSTATEANNAGYANGLPIYTHITVAAAPASICTTDAFGFYNKLANDRYFYFQTSAAARTVTVAPITAGGMPNFVVYSAGTPIMASNNGASLTQTSVSVNSSLALPAGTYYGQVFDSNIYTGPANAVPVEICFAVSVN